MRRLKVIAYRGLLGAGFSTWVLGGGYLLLSLVLVMTGGSMPAVLEGLATTIKESLLYWPMVALALAPLIWIVAEGSDAEDEEEGSKTLAKKAKIGACLRDYLDCPMAELSSRSYDFQTCRLPDLDVAIDAFVGGEGVEESRLGWVDDGYSLDKPQLINLVGAKRRRDYGVGPVEERSILVGPDQRRSCIWRGLRMITRGENRLAVQVRHTERRFDAQNLTLDVVSPDANYGQELIDFVRDHVEKHSIYAGRVISLDADRGPRYDVDHLGIHFHRLEAVERDELILPAQTMELLERSTLEFVEHRSGLQRHGRDVRRGILLHGPPGTGKSYAIRYLSAALPRHTTLLAVGSEQQLIANYFRLARILAPSMLVFEDVDLIAVERGSGGRTDLLHELLNQMDGLEQDSEVLVVMTTNQEDVLEPALAKRPGRVDQAIEFPLPDPDCRRRLFALYGRGVTLELEDEDDLVRRTDGASAAFIKELFRRATLLALQERSTTTGNGELVLRDEHLGTALRELTLSGGELTRQLLGFA